MKILRGRSDGTKGGVSLSSSAGHLNIDRSELEHPPSHHHHDVTKSPGFRREKQMDKQRKREKKELEEQMSSVGESKEEHKSSFAQCTFNMANILMVSHISFLLYMFVHVYVYVCLCPS